MQLQNALSLSQQETVVPLATVSGRGCQCTVYICICIYLPHIKQLHIKFYSLKVQKNVQEEMARRSKETIKLTVKF